MLRAIGTAHPAGPDGRLPRLGSPPAPPWDGYARQITAELERTLGPNLLSVAMRGSTVRATAVIGVSDLDLVVVTNAKVMSVTVPHIVAAPDLDVETALATESELVQDPRFAWLRFNLAFCGHTVWGHDYIAELPDPVLDRVALAHVKSVDSWLAQWPKMFAQAQDDAERRAICVWLMKRVVRSLFEGIMLEEGVYTRDIYPCADVAARYYPTQRSAIFAAAELVVTPTSDPSEIRSALEPLLPELLQAKERYVLQEQTKRTIAQA